MPPELFIVADIVRPHGRRGEVVLKPRTDSVQTLLTAPLFHVVPGADEPVRVESARLHKGACLVKLEAVDTISAAEALAGRSLCLPREALRPLDPGEYFLHDLVGLSVMDRDGRMVGTVEWILETGGPPVLAGTRVEGGEFMVPFVGPLVDKVDLGAGSLRLNDPDGLLELEEK